MRTKDNYTQKDVANVGYKILYQHKYMLTGRVKLDKRYNFNRDVLRFLKENALSTDEVKRVVKLRKERIFNRMVKPFMNIYEEPIIRDYVNNKHALLAVFSDRMRFGGGRNHWAKDEKDLKILSILKKHFMNNLNKQGYNQSNNRVKSKRITKQIKN